jgi:hypothetical protein
MPYERIAHYRHDPDRSDPSPGSTIIDGLEVVDDQVVVLAPLETVGSTDRQGTAQAPRSVPYRPRAQRSPRGLG